MTEQKRIFDKNIERVKSICSLYTSLKGENKKDGKEYILTDMLRAAVVFLHSSFEEYFRKIIIDILPKKATNETLKHIPISLYAGVRNPDKIFLSDLSMYKNLSINEVIEESISKHMELKSFNSAEEIRVWLSKVMIDFSTFDKFDTIDKAVKRRHKIVHEADTNRTNDGERLTSIKSGDIKPWIEAYVELVSLIENQIEKWEKDNEHTNQ